MEDHLAVAPVRRQRRLVVVVRRTGQLMLIAAARPDDELTSFPLYRCFDPADERGQGDWKFSLGHS
jgi:hypothetical protein